MKPYFNYFANIIPQEMYSRTKAHICKYIAIFEPEEYAVGKVFCADDYHFMLFLGSAPVTRISNTEYHIKKGDLLVIKPWEEVYGVPCDNRDYGKYMQISVKKDFFQEISAGVTSGDAFQFKHIQGTYSQELLDLIGNFQRELMNYGESYPQMLHSISTQIVFQLIRDLNADNVKNKGKIGKDNQYINKAILYMQQYYNANINISDICNLIYLSPCHLSGYLRSIWDRPPISI